jgi:hypothetical protein
MEQVKKSKPVPEGIMHKPSPMAWAQLTPMSEHKERLANGIEAEIIEAPEAPTPKDTKREPLPLTRAKSDLRRVYPYIFDCAAYVLTHNPERIETDLFYSRFTMPYSVFLDYCLDTCTDQTDYLKAELYHVLIGQPAKYIKVSPERTVFAPPIVIALSHTDPKTGRLKSIKNIGQDKMVDLIQVQIIKELLTFDIGYLNQPKAFYAKIRSAYTAMQRGAHRFDGLEYREAITKAGELIYNSTGTIADTSLATALINNVQRHAPLLEKMEQGGFYQVYLALEYIVGKKGRYAKVKDDYSLLELCEKCAPELVENKEGTLYFRDRDTAEGLLIMLQVFVDILSTERALGIKQIEQPKYNTKTRDTTFLVRFR